MLKMQSKKQKKVIYYQCDGPIAQRLEQATHNRLVPGSNPGGPTILINGFITFRVSGLAKLCLFLCLWWGKVVIAIIANLAALGGMERFNSCCSRSRQVLR